MERHKLLVFLLFGCAKPHKSWPKVRDRLQTPKGQESLSVSETKIEMTVHPSSHLTSSHPTFPPQT